MWVLTPDQTQKIERIEHALSAWLLHGAHRAGGDTAKAAVQLLQRQLFEELLTFYCEALNVHKGLLPDDSLIPDVTTARRWLDEVTRLSRGQLNSDVMHPLRPVADAVFEQVVRLELVWCNDTIGVVRAPVYVRFLMACVFDLRISLPCLGELIHGSCSQQPHPLDVEQPLCGRFSSVVGMETS